MNEKNGEHPLGHAGQILSLGAFLIVWVTDSFFLRMSTFLSHFVPLYARLAILGSILVVAIYLFRSGHAVVSHDQRPSRVVTTGAFHYVRHPLYLASILTYVGLSVATASLFSVALVVGIWIFYDHIATYEEKLLAEKFGEDYNGYKKRTGKWIPKSAGKL
jgi:protein-S-isoprenylcysteine O-methyltransferase Ste14